MFSTILLAVILAAIAVLVGLACAGRFELGDFTTQDGEHSGDGYGHRRGGWARAITDPSHPHHFLTRSRGD